MPSRKILRMFTVQKTRDANVCFIVYRSPVPYGSIDHPFLKVSTFVPTWLSYVIKITSDPAEAFRG